MTDMVTYRFRETNDYAWAHRFLSGFPNFHEADYGLGPVYGTMLLGSDVAEWRDIPARELGDPNPEDFGARFRATNDWAGRHGYLSGYPNFHHANYGAGTVYGTILVKQGGAEWRDIPASELGNPNPLDIGARFRATNDWATRNGFAAGFPNFHEANYGNGTVYGTILFRVGRVQWRDVYASVMGIFSRFTFDAAITVEQRRRLLERHSFALTRNATCESVTAEERTKLRSAYGRTIWHGVNTDPGANASAQINGSSVWVNFTNLFPAGDNEIAQSLIHEMMHCAGYRHPERRNSPDPNPDVPGDNGLYYGSPPLRAEFCIAGVQSDVLTAQSAKFPAMPRSCAEVNGVFVVKTESSPSIEHVSGTPEDVEIDVGPMQSEVAELRARVERLEAVPDAAMALSNALHQPAVAGLREPGLNGK